MIYLIILQKKKTKLKNYNDVDDNDDEQKEMKYEDSINLIVHAVLDELKNNENSRQKKNENNWTIIFNLLIAKEIIFYLKILIFLKNYKN